MVRRIILPYGLEIYNESGKTIYSSDWGVGRILGSFTTTTRTGNLKITDGDASNPKRRVFAYQVPFKPAYTIFGYKLQPVYESVYTNLDTVYWIEVDIGTKIVYGECIYG